MGRQYGDIGGKDIDTFLHIPSGEKYHPVEQTYFSNCYLSVSKTLGHAAEEYYDHRYGYHNKVYRNAIGPKDCVAFTVRLTSGGKNYETLTESISTWSTGSAVNQVMKC